MHLDEDIKKLLVDAKQQGLTMKVRHAKILFCGASGAGKTSFCQLLKNIPLDKKRNSTGLGDSQQIMVTEKATMKNNEWTHLLPEEEIHQLKLRLKHGKLSEPNTQSFKSQSDNPIAGPKIASHSQLQYKVENKQAQSTKKSYFEKISKKIPEVEKCLTSNFYNAEKQDVSSAELPKVWDILTLLDTGGQPQFINMLPAVNSSATITFVVLKMAGEGKILEEKIQVHHFKNGRKSYEPYPLNYTNEDLIKCLVGLLKDSIVRDIPLPVECISEKATDHKPGLCFVGTHLDIVDQKTVDSIDKKIEDLVDNLEPNDNIYIFNLDKILFAVNNTVAGKDSSPDSIANKIRMKVKKMVEKKAVYEVPIAWILLELEIRRICNKQKRSFLPISKVLTIYASIIENDDTADVCDTLQVHVKAALQFHHTFGVLLYFHDVPGMKEYVISNPQWLFANLTNLVCCSFDGTIVDRSDIKKLKCKGILSENLIREINTDSLGGIEIQHFFSLLQHLKIVTPFPKPDSSDYLMLSILDSFKGEKSSLLDSLPASIELLLIQFKSGTLPRGIFCCLVVQLIQIKSTEWALQPILNEQRCVYENLVIFFIQYSGHYLVLFDKVTHLEIQMRPIASENDSNKTYYKVRQFITDALKEVCSCTDNDLKYGFYCTKQYCLKPILTLSSEQMNDQKSFPPYLQCENHGHVDIKSHNLWCKPTIKGKYMHTYVRTCTYVYIAI